MLQKNIIAGLLLTIFSLNGFATEAELSKEAKKYKTLKELCLKSKEWSQFGKISMMIRWSSDCIFMRGVKQIEKSKEGYSALSPYVFANMKSGNVFLKVDGFTNYQYIRNETGGYEIRLEHNNISKNNLAKIYADFSKQFKKIDFETKKENRDLASVKKTIKTLHKALRTEQSDYEFELRNAIPKVYTWDTTTYSNNGDKLVFKVITMTNARGYEISGTIVYTAE